MNGRCIGVRNGCGPRVSVDAVVGGSALRAGRGDRLDLRWQHSGSLRQLRDERGAVPHQKLGCGRQRLGLPFDHQRQVEKIVRAHPVPAVPEHALAQAGGDGAKPADREDAGPAHRLPKYITSFSCAKCAGLETGSEPESISSVAEQHAKTHSV